MPRDAEPNGRSIHYLAPCGVSVFDLRDDDFEHISDLLRPMRRASAAMIDLDVRARLSGTSAWSLPVPASQPAAGQMGAQG
jgi:hypothetical protein